MALLPVLRRLPRRVDRVTSALERGRLSVNVRLFAAERDRAVVNGMLHELLLASTGGPRVAPELTLHQLFWLQPAGGQCSAGAAAAVHGVPVATPEHWQGDRN
jgi:hypothetical protein